PEYLDAQLADIVNALATSGPAVADINSVANEAAIGVGTPSYTIDEHHNRSSVRDHLVEVELERRGKLHFALDTLATRILLCDAGSGGAPAAYGVEIAPGAALAVASNFEGKERLRTRRIMVRHEVIVSAGVFQSPQLVRLSGIGDREHLAEHGLEAIVNLPGVGTNLQGMLCHNFCSTFHSSTCNIDHDEVANIWTLKQNYTLFNGCTVLYTPEDDPCLKFWAESGHQNLYSLGAALFMNMTKSVPCVPAPDIMTYWVPGFFRGFFPGFAQQLAGIHNGFTAVVLKANTTTRGVVRLTGSHPQDPLRIEKRHFEAPGGREDVVAIREAIKVARRLVEHSNITEHIAAQVFPEPEVQTDEEIENHILEHVFGS
ncbi:GMC oxidoreductase-domain-containing protein, partial [Mycena filopes]